MNKIAQNKKQINKEMLMLFNVFFGVSFWSFGLIIVCTLLFLPFPERMSLNYMDYQMKEIGEGVSLIFLFLFGSLTVSSFLGLFLTSTLISFYQVFLGTKNELLTSKEWYKTLILLVGCGIYIVFSCILFWLVFVDLKINVLVKKSFTKLETKTISRNRKIWISFLSIFSILVFSIIPIVFLTSSIYDPSKVPNRKADLENAYTISENKPNTIVLYFDRGYGLFWNEMLMIDYLMTHDSNIPIQYKPQYSFIEEFPEFTSYVNSLSQGSLTNVSNPLINGSWYYQPNLKDQNVLDPFYLDEYKNITMNKWFLNSYRNGLGLFSKYGYENLSMIGNPYYGEITYQLNSNELQLQNDLTSLWKNKTFYPQDSKLNYNQNNIFTCLDSTEIVKSLGLTPTGKRVDSLVSLQNLANTKNDSIDLSVSKNVNSSYLFLHFNTTHENYCYVKNNGLVNNSYNPGGINYQDINNGEAIMTNNDDNNFVISVWYALQKTKSILKYLKTLKCSDPNRPDIKNQYDNTNFYVISDHGNILSNNHSYFDLMQDYLLSKNKMSQKEHQYILQQYFNGYQSPSIFNSIFMRKPAKYQNHKNWNTQNDIVTFFNKEQLIVNSDFYPIFEFDIQRQLFDLDPSNSQKDFKFDEKTSWYWNQNTNSKYKLISDDLETQKLINEEFNDNFLINPLENPKSYLNARTIPLFRAEWFFKPNAHSYKITSKNYYLPKYPNGIFNLKNFTKSKN